MVQSHIKKRFRQKDVADPPLEPKHTPEDARAFCECCGIPGYIVDMVAWRGLHFCNQICLDGFVIEAASDEDCLRWIHDKIPELCLFLSENKELILDGLCDSASVISIFCRIVREYARWTDGFTDWIDSHSIFAPD